MKQIPENEHGVALLKQAIAAFESDPNPESQAVAGILYAASGAYAAGDAVSFLCHIKDAIMLHHDHAMKMASLMPIKGYSKN